MLLTTGRILSVSRAAVGSVRSRTALPRGWFLRVFYALYPEHSAGGFKWFSQAGGLRSHVSAAENHLERPQLQKLAETRLLNVGDLMQS